MEHSIVVPIAGFFVRRFNSMLSVAPAQDWLFYLHFVVRRINSMVSLAPLQDWYMLTGTCAKRLHVVLQSGSVCDLWASFKRTLEQIVSVTSTVHTCMVFGSVVSHSRKAILWLLPRTGSRAVSSLMTHMGFINDLTKVSLADEHCHSVGIPKGCQDYHITATIRNPYSWVLSCWHLWGEGKTFKEYLNTQGALIPLKALKRLKYYREPDVWVRYEDMDQDVLKIPYVTNDPLSMALVDTLKDNVYTEEIPMGVLRRDPKNPRYTDYLSYYDQDDLDKVYTIYEEYFKKFGYKREFKDQSQSNQPD